MRRPSESRLYQPTLRGLLRLSWATQMSLAAAEVPWHQKRLDLVLVSPGRGLLSFELKVEAWRRAVSQAYLNRWTCHGAWIAVWHTHLGRGAFRAAKEAGVGIFIVTHNAAYPCLWPAEPPESGSVTRLEGLIRKRGDRVRDLLGKVGK